MNNKNLPICANCIYCSPSGKVCRRIQTFDIVTGENVIVPVSCYSERDNGWLRMMLYGSCGKAGRFYIEKHTIPKGN